MAKYKVVDGKYHTKGKVYLPGDVVELKSVPAAFSDRFVAVEEKKPETKQAEAPKAPAAPSGSGGNA